MLGLPRNSAEARANRSRSGRQGYELPACDLHFVPRATTRFVVELVAAESDELIPLLHNPLCDVCEPVRAFKKMRLIVVSVTQTL